MRRIVGSACLVSLLAIGLALLGGCFGVTQNPSYFPYFMPAKDVIPTHAKPGGFGYFANFDPHAVTLNVTPCEATNPVRTQHLLIATVMDEKGVPRRNRRVEWMLEGVGNIIEVDESGYFPGRGYKVDNHYAVSYTDYCEHTIHKHMGVQGEDGSPLPGNLADDFVIHPGQTWCVISSSVEGDSHVIAYAPEIADWDHHKVFVVKHWVDAEWIWPEPAINLVGTDHVFTTTVQRRTDHQRLAGYRVRYTILDGPPAGFLPDKSKEFVATSDLNGLARATLVQLTPQVGINRILVEIIRPPDPRTPSGVGMVIARRETTKEWRGASIALTKTGPATASVGQEIPYTITVSNTGQIEIKASTVRDVIPDGLQFVRAQPALTATEGNQLVWTVGRIAGQQNQMIDVVFKSTRVGTVTNHASVVTEEGLKDEKSVNTEITSAGIKVTKTGPASGVVGSPIAYQITVTNLGGGPATNVMLRDDFDPGLEHESKPASNQVDLKLGTLAPGETKNIPITLTPRKTGTLMNRVEVTADGNLKDQAQHPVVVSEAKLALTKTGPAMRYKDRDADWEIKVTNAGDVPVTGVVVRDLLPPQLTFAKALDGGLLDGGQVVWNIGALQPREERVVHVTTHCNEIAQQVVNVATASADTGLQARAEAPININGMATFRVELIDLNDPVAVGDKTSYQINVINQGTMPGNQVAIKAQVPAQMRITGVKGPSANHIDGQIVTFDPLDGLKPRDTWTYTIEVQALQPGDVRLITWLSEATLSAPVENQESTNIIVPPAQPRPLGPAAPGPAPLPPLPSPAPPPAPGASIFNPAPSGVIATSGSEPPLAGSDVPAPVSPP